MAVDQNVLLAERTRLQNEVNSLNNQIASLSGEIKAHLQALGITEAEVANSTQEAHAALTKAQAEFDALYASYEQFKLASAAPVTPQAPQL